MSQRDLQFIKRALEHPWMFWVYFWKWPRIVRQACEEYDMVAQERDIAKAAYEKAVRANKIVRDWIHVTHRLDMTADLRAIWTAGKRLMILFFFFVASNAFGQAPPYLRNQWTTNANPLAVKVISTNGVRAATNIWELDFTNSATVTVNAVSNANKVILSFTGSGTNGGGAGSSNYIQNLDGLGTNTTFTSSATTNVSVKVNGIPSLSTNLIEWNDGTNRVGFIGAQNIQLLENRKGNAYVSVGDTEAAKTFWGFPYNEFWFSLFSTNVQDTEGLWGCIAPGTSKESTIWWWTDTVHNPMAALIQLRVANTNISSVIRLKPIVSITNPTNSSSSVLEFQTLVGAGNPRQNLIQLNGSVFDNNAATFFASLIGISNAPFAQFDSYQSAGVPLSKFKVGPRGNIESSGTVTNLFPPFSASQIWSNSAVAFSGIKLNITNASSAAGSYLMELQSSSNQIFNVRIDGVAYFSNTITNDTGTTNAMIWKDISGGTYTRTYTSNGVFYSSASPPFRTVDADAWPVVTNIATVSITNISHDPLAAGQIAITNGNIGPDRKFKSLQAGSNVTLTDQGTNIVIAASGTGGGIASVYTNNVLAGGPGLTELGFTNTATVTWVATTNAGRVTMSATSAAGAQTPWISDIDAAAFSLTNFGSTVAFTNGSKIGATATNTLTLTNSHLIFSPDNVWDIGASGATRPRDLYMAGKVGVSGTFLRSDANRVFILGNTSGTFPTTSSANDIYSFGALAASGASYTNSDSIFNIGSESGRNQIVTDSEFIFSFGDRALKNSTVSGSFNIHMVGNQAGSGASMVNGCDDIYGTGYRPFLNAAITNSNYIFAWGKDVGNGAVFSSRNNLFLLGDAPKPSLTSDEMAFSVASSGQFTFSNAPVKISNNLMVQGNASVAGGLNFSRFATNANVSMVTNFYVWAVTSVAVIVTNTLPSASTSQGIHFIIKDEGGNASATNITIAVQSGDRIDGATTATLNVNYAAKNVYSTGGTNWFIY